MHFSPSVKNPICILYVFVVAKPPALDSGGLLSYNKKNATEQVFFFIGIMKEDERKVRK